MRFAESVPGTIDLQVCSGVPHVCVSLFRIHQSAAMLQKPTRENKEQAVRVLYSDARVTYREPPSASVQEHVNIISFSNRSEWKFGEHHGAYNPSFSACFSAETVFFSHNKSVEIVFRFIFSAKRTASH